MKWLVALLAIPALAGETVLLTTGFQISAQRHEIDGAVIRIYTDQGVSEMPVDMVAEIESSPVKQPEPRPVEVEAPKKREPSAKELVKQAAERYGLPPEIVDSLVQVESAYQPGAVSPKGAIGLMQLMPATAAALDADPKDPRQNVEVGTRLLRELLIKYQNYPDQVKRALAAYNAGEGSVERYNGVPPYRETRLYVDKVIERYRRLTTSSQ